jgi:hypothetical protein
MTLVCGGTKATQPTWHESDAGLRSTEIPSRLIPCCRNGCHAGQSVRASWLPHVHPSSGHVRLRLGPMGLNEVQSPAAGTTLVSCLRLWQRARRRLGSGSVRCVHSIGPAGNEGCIKGATRYLLTLQTIAHVYMHRRHCDTQNQAHLNLFLPSHLKPPSQGRLHYRQAPTWMKVAQLPIGAPLSLNFLTAWSSAYGMLSAVIISPSNSFS